jgi:hypothetical protein
LVAAEGKLESGSTANPKTLRINEAVHVRIVGEGKTICGIKLTPDYSTRWQWHGRGQFGERLPHSMRHAVEHSWDTPCQHCANHPIVTLTLEAEEKEHARLAREHAAAQEKTAHLRRRREARRRAREEARCRASS